MEKEEIYELETVDLEKITKYREWNFEKTKLIGTPLRPADCGYLNPVSILSNISKLLKNDNISDEEKNVIKDLGNIFITQLTCSVCTQQTWEIICLAMIRSYCEQNGVTTKSFYEVGDSMPLSCPYIDKRFVKKTR